MTFKQAMEAALRELGHSEEEIRTRMVFATAMTPGAPKDAEVNAGCERELIDYLVGLGKNPKFLALALAESQKAQSKN